MQNRWAGYRKSIYRLTSTRLQDGTRNDVAFDLNVRMVLLAHELGLGYGKINASFPLWSNVALWITSMTNESIAVLSSPHTPTHTNTAPL